MDLDNIKAELRNGDLITLSENTGYSWSTIQKVFNNKYALHTESAKTIIKAAQKLIDYRNRRKPKRTKRAYTIKSKTNN